MEDNTNRKKMALPLFIAMAIVVAAVAIVLTWQQSEHDRAEAAGGGPEMTLSVESGSTTCPLGTGPDTTCVMAGDPFTLAVEAVGIPAPGYILAQTFIDYATFNPAASEDGAGPDTCSDGNDNGGGDGKDRVDTDCVTVDLVYKPQALVADEFAWPDLLGATALKSEFAPGVVAHGGLTGLFPPLPASFYLGNLVVLDFTCSASSTSTLVQLLPNGDPVASTSGSVFTEFDSLVQITPKVDTLTIKCVGPTPTPSDTPVPPTATPTVSPTPTDTPTPLPPPSERPDVKVTKVDLVDPVDSGGKISYQITVESIGSQTAENVVVVDTLPAGAVFNGAISGSATCNEAAGVVTCEVTDDMLPTAVIIIGISITAPTGADELIDNIVTVSSTNEPFANTGNNKDIEQTMVLAPRSDVILSKVGDPTFLDVGGDVTYALVAKNLGPNTAQNVQIVDTLPDNATFVSATNPECGAPSGGKVTCDLGNLAPDAESIVQIVMNVPNVTRSILLKNLAVVSADNELFFQTGNNLAVANTPVVAPPPDLIVTKTDSQDPVLRLGFYSYEITVLNDGDGDALDVVVTDTLPFATIELAETHFSSVTFQSAAGATCEAIPGDKVECLVDEINAHQQLVITLNVRAPTLLEDENIINNVTASASDPDEDPVGNDATEATLVRACFDVTGDLIVDLPNDILTMIDHLGLYEGDVGYDVIYDFEGDGFIGLVNDLLPVLQHWLQDCSLLL